MASEDGSSKKCCFCQSNITDPLLLMCSHQICFNCVCSYETLSEDKSYSFIECCYCGRRTSTKELQFLGDEEEGYFQRQSEDEQAISEDQNEQKNDYRQQTHQMQRQKEHHSLENIIVPEQRILTGQRQTIQQENTVYMPNHMNELSGKRNKCITPEKLTERPLDMSPKDSVANRRKKELILGDQAFNSTLVKQRKGMSSEKSSQIASYQKEYSQQKIQTNSPLNPSRVNLNECPYHQELFSLFCETDKKLCCVTCVYKGSGHHHNHHIMPLKQCFGLLKQELGIFKAKHQDKIHQIDETIRIQKNHKHAILKTFINYKELVQQEFEKLILLLTARQQAAVEEINSNFSQKLHESDLTLKSLQQIRVQMKRFKEFDNSIKNTDLMHSVKVYALKQLLSKDLKQFESIALIENNKEEINLFDFQNKNTIIQEIQNFGKVRNSLAKHASLKTSSGTTSKSPKYTSNKNIFSSFTNLQAKLKKSTDLKSGVVDEETLSEQKAKKIFLDGIPSIQKNVPNNNRSLSPSFSQQISSNTCKASTGLCEKSIFESTNPQTMKTKEDLFKKGLQFSVKPPLMQTQKRQTYQNTETIPSLRKSVHSSSTKDITRLNTLQSNQSSKQTDILKETNEQFNKSKLGLINSQSNSFQTSASQKGGTYLSKNIPQIVSQKRGSAAKFSSLSEQIRMLTKDVPDFEDEKNREKENNLCEPDDQQITYLNQTSPYKNWQASDETKIGSIQQIAMNMQRSGTTHLSEEAFKKRVVNQLNNLKNTREAQLSQEVQLKNSQSNLNQNSHMSFACNSGSRSPKNPQCLQNLESLDNSCDLNDEAIKKLNEDILYENFTPHSQQSLDGLMKSNPQVSLENGKERFADAFDYKSTQNIPIKISQRGQNTQFRLPPNRGLPFQDSQILNSGIRDDLLNMLPFSLKCSTLLYSLNDDKPSSDTFHQKCDGKGPYLVIIKANSFVFGYYLPISFDKCDMYVTCQNAFIFSLINPYNTSPLLFPVKPDKKFIALYQSVKSPCIGTTLQSKEDLWIKQFPYSLIFICNILYQINTALTIHKTPFLALVIYQIQPETNISHYYLYFKGYAYDLDPQFDGNKILAGQYTDWNVQGIEVFNINS